MIFLRQSLWFAAIVSWMLLWEPSAALVVAMQARDLESMQRINARHGAPMRVDADRLAATDIRMVEGQHLRLFTDVRPGTDVDQLTQVFDAAVPIWCQYFEVDSTRCEGWRMRAYVMENPDRFIRAGLIPDDLPKFPAGYQRGPEMWLFVQPGNYYTRHLLLHEGTHAFMDWFLDGLGSPWYAEGMAELLALNRWQTASAENLLPLQLNYRPSSTDEVDYWGRPKVIHDAKDAGKLKSLDEVLHLPAAEFRDVKAYAWAWAACEFLSHHPRSENEFKKLIQSVHEPSDKFDQAVRKAFDSEMSILERDWQLYLHELDYGTDVTKTWLQPIEQVETPDQRWTVKVAADHGWQQTLIAVQPGDRFQIKGSGRFQIGQSQIVSAERGELERRSWPCEANGITLEYYAGRPLGMLLAGVAKPLDSNRSHRDKEGAAIHAPVAGLVDALPVGLENVVEFKDDGFICLRVNESPAKMGDNQGTLEVIIEKLK